MLKCLAKTKTKIKKNFFKNFFRLTKTFAVNSFPGFQWGNYKLHFIPIRQIARKKLFLGFSRLFLWNFNGVCHYFILLYCKEVLFSTSFLFGSKLYFFLQFGVLASFSCPFQETLRLWNLLFNGLLPVTLRFSS